MDNRTYRDTMWRLCQRAHDFRQKTADRQPARVVEILAFPVVQFLDIAGPLQVLACANEHVVRTGGQARYALRAGGVASAAGFELAAAPLPDVRAPVDTPVVASGPGVMAGCCDATLVS